LKDSKKTYENGARKEVRGWGPRRRPRKMGEKTIRKTEKQSLGDRGNEGTLIEKLKLFGRPGESGTRAEFT